MKLNKLILLGIVGIVSAAAGIAVPRMMSGQSHDSTDPHKTDAHAADAGHGKKEKEKEPAKKPADKSGHAAAGHGAGDHGKPGDAKVRRPGPYYVPFERVVVNLNDPNLTKYLELDFSLEVDEPDEASVIEAITIRKAVLRSWAIEYLADKTIDDIRGRVGVNQLRREIQDNFNKLLFNDGRDRVRDVHIEEFHVN